MGVFKQEKLHEAKEQWISTPDGVLLTRAPPPKKRKKQNKTKQQKKAETKTEKKNKETKQSTTMEHLLTRGNFFACNLSRNFATSWEVWRNY